jgi:hypothetical protein
MGLPRSPDRSKRCGILPAMSITKNTVVQRRKDALSAQVGDDIVLMNSKVDNYYGLDKIGSDIWQRMEQPIAVERLCAELTSVYEGDAATIETEVLELLERLRQSGLIDSVPG